MSEPINPLYYEGGQIYQTNDVDPLSQYSHLKTGWNPDAFVDEVDITVNSGNRTITVSPQGDYAEFWTAGTRHTLNGPESATWDDTEGAWYFTINGDGVSFSQVEYDISDEGNALVSSLYWDATNNKVITWTPELHSWALSRKLHEYLHETFGTRYSSGLGISLNTSNITVDVANGEIYDEDIECEIFDTGGPGKWVQALSPLECPKQYRLGSNNWRSSEVNSSLVLFDGTAPQVNTFNGTEWVLSDVGPSKYFAMWVVASTSADGYPVYMIVGQNDGDYQSEVQQANTLHSLSVYGIASREHKVIARIILQRSNQSPYYSVASIDDYRNVADEPLSGGADPITVDHGALVGLEDDDHSQYALADGSRTFTGNVTVSGTVNATGFSANGTDGVTANVAVDYSGGTRTLHFINGLYTGHTDS